MKGLVIFFSVVTVLSVSSAFPMLNPSIHSNTCPVEIDEDPPASSRQAAFNMSNLPSFLQRAVSPRIVNGDFLSPNLIPYMVFVAGGCTATMVSPTWFVSAAHCEIDAGHEVAIGISAARQIPVANVRTVINAYNHPSYVDLERGLGDEFDIGVFEIDSAAPAGTKFMKVNADAEFPETDEFVRVMGFGLTKIDEEGDGIARQVDLPVTNEDKCAKANNPTAGKIFPDKQFCAGYDRGGCDSCKGDSGGPVIQYEKEGEPALLGVVSFGDGCAEPEKPGVYVRTSAYIDFFDANGVQYTKASLEKKSGGLSTGAIIGIVIGAVVAAVLLIALVVYCIRR